jgi:hypothetical protein
MNSRYNQRDVEIDKILECPGNAAPYVNRSICSMLAVVVGNEHPAVGHDVAIITASSYCLDAPELIPAGFQFRAKYGKRQGTVAR